MKFELSVPSIEIPAEESKVRAPTASRSKMPAESKSNPVAPL